MKWMLALAVLSIAAPVRADPPPRPPEQRQTVIDLAHVLGEVHALHRACAGDDDNLWRRQMSLLLKAEAPDAAYKRSLTQSFNSGFVAAQAEFPVCTDKSQSAEQAAEQRGRALARQLAAPTQP
jgi:uncharacterized protein (TIGR02301 family)